MAAQTRLSKDIGSRIRSARIKARLTQVQAGERAGIQQADWSDYETGQLTPGLGVATRIAAALGTTVSKLTKGV